MREAEVDGYFFVGSRNMKSSEAPVCLPTEADGPYPALYNCFYLVGTRGTPSGRNSDTVGYRYLHLPSLSDAAAVSRQKAASKGRNKYPMSCELWSWPGAMTRDGKLYLSRLHAVYRC